MLEMLQTLLSQLLLSDQIVRKKMQFSVPSLKHLEGGVYVVFLILSCCVVFFVILKSLG